MVATNFNYTICASAFDPSHATGVFLYPLKIKEVF